MKRIGITVMVAGMLMVAQSAWAAGDAGHDSHSGDGHGTAQVQQTPASSTAPAVKTDAAQAHNMTHEEHMNMMTNTSSSGATNNMSGMTHDTSSSSHDMSGMTHDMSTMNQPQDTNAGHSAHSHGGTAEVVETPPNIAVLGTFGGIMLAFILYGGITKIMRRKERAQA